MNIYLELFLTFFKIGLFTFGGGYAMIPMIREELTVRGWASIETVIDFIAVSESTPGPFAVNMATFIGNSTAGFFGSVCATFGVVLPSFIVILLVAKFFADFSDNRIVKAVMHGLRPAVVGLIGAAALSIGRAAFIDNTAKYYINLKSVVIFAVVFALSRIYKKAHPIVLILASVILGIFMFGILPMFA